jgi:hypothetical protein
MINIDQNTSKILKLWHIGRHIKKKYYEGNILNQLKLIMINLQNLQYGM